MTAIAIAVYATCDTRPAVIAFDAEGLVCTTARIIVAGVTGKAVAIYALTCVGVVAIVVGAAINALIPVIADDTIGRIDSASVIGTQLTRLALTSGTQGLMGVIALPIALAIPTDIALGRLDAQWCVTTATLVCKHLAGTAGALVTDALTRLVAVVIVCALSAFSTSPTISTEGCVSTAANVTLDQTRLALTIVALAAIGVVTTAVV